MASTPGEREKQLRALREARAGSVAVKERPKASVSGGHEPPPKPPIVAASPDRGNGSMVIRGISDALLNRLERARAQRGLRSRNDVVLAILNEGTPK